LQAILSADLIVVGPGSLYTSLLPNLLVPDLAEAVRASRALKFYVCNVASQPGETDGFSCGDHVRALESYMGGHIFDLVIVNNVMNGKLPKNIEWIKPEPDLDQHFAVYKTDLVDDEKPWRHGSKKIGQTVMDLYYERTGPLIPHESS
jgi:uncharacterized cofD-like protein